MKWLDTSSLQRKALVVLAAFTVLSVGEWFAVRWAYTQINQAEIQLDLARSSEILLLQLDALASKPSQHLEEHTQQVGLLTDKLDYQLEIMATGGRPEGTRTLVDPVHALTAITLKSLRQKWQEYQSLMSTVITKNTYKDSVLLLTSATDSAMAVQQTVLTKAINEEVAQAKWALNAKLAALHNNFSLLIADLKQEKENAELLIKIVIGFCVLTNIVFMAGIYLLFGKLIVNPVQQFTRAVATRTPVAEVDSRELNELSSALKKVLDQLNHASAFVQTIGDGKLDVAYGGNAEERNDILAQSLMLMQSKLKTMNEEEQKRAWTNEGLTRFVDILRSGSDNVYVLGDSIVSELVGYTRSHIGALYVVNDDEGNTFLELISLFAFNHKKYEQQKLKVGEGLVGQTYLEKETIYLKEIPTDYIRITSGLGSTEPRSILVVPLKVDQDVYGVVELASLSEYQPHEVTFVEKLGETLASTLAATKTNQRNRKLLEDSQTVAEMMRAQEEEMRQNMEELTATQEELLRKEKDYQQKIDSLETALAAAQQGADWALADEMEKQLRLHLDMMKIREQATRAK